MGSLIGKPGKPSLLAFFFIFSEMWVAEFLLYRFRRAQSRGREFAGATEVEPAASCFLQGGERQNRYQQIERQAISRQSSSLVLLALPNASW